MNKVIPKIVKDFVIISAVLMLSGIFVEPGLASDAKGKVSGLFFGDYYWFAESHEPTHEGQNGLWLRRLELTYERELAENFSGKLKLEMNQNDFTSTTSSNMTPFVKDAYLKWKIGETHDISFGLFAPPTFSLVEEHWGYRSVERTPLDLFKLASSRDGGIAIRGYADHRKRFGYQLMSGNGTGTGHETNEQKKFYLSLHAGKISKLIVQLYGDYEGKNSNESTRTLQAFLGGGGDAGRAGLLFARQTQEQGIGNPSKEMDVASAYGILDIAENLSAYIRVDHLFDPNSKADKIAYIPMIKTAKETTVYILGADYRVAKNISFLPNVEVVSYGEDTADSSIKHDDDIIGRLTIFFKL